MSTTSEGRAKELALPPNRWLNRLADTPPGEAASSIRPTASSGGRPKPSASPKATQGSTMICKVRPISTARG